jgi:hypothetical protein
VRGRKREDERQEPGSLGLGARRKMRKRKEKEMKEIAMVR